MRAADRAVLTLGVASLFSASLTFAGRDPWALVTMPDTAVPIAVSLGLAAGATAVLRRRVLQVVVGGAFLVAAATVLLDLALGQAWIGGDGSTLALWLGLGAGTAAAGTAPRDADTAGNAMDEAAGTTSRKERGDGNGA